MLEGKNLHKYYKMGETVVKALRGINIKLEEGNFTYIVGPSGSGKTTLLDLLGALSRPTKGKVLYKGKELNKFNDYQLSMFRRKKVGFVFQTYNLNKSLTALENVLVPLQPIGITKKDRLKARKLLKETGLGKRINHKPTQLSGGEIQRVTVARAMINDPDIVLADEPTGELDSKTGEKVMKYMRKMNEEKNTSFLIVTHDAEYIEKGDRLIEMKDGKLIKDGINKEKWIH
ncbi:MAG: ABC transporter ATP-binding protein [archaeon]